MTAAQLLSYITAALLLQVLAGVAFAVWRRFSMAGASAPAGIEQAVASAGYAAGAWSGWRDFRVVRRGFEDAAQTQCSFYLQPVDGEPLEPFRPGQYLTFSLKVPEGVVGVAGVGGVAGVSSAGGAVGVAGVAGAAVGKRTITRCYSLSDRPEPTGYRITIKRAPPPAAQPQLPPGLSSGHFHDRVHAGDVLQVKAPSGHFFIDPDASVPAVFIAGGIGITPMMSMLRWCVAEQPERRIHLYYGVRSSGDHAFKQVLEELTAAHPAFRLTVVYGSPGADDVQGRDYQHVGYIDMALLRRTLRHGRHQFYVCGPQPMMQSLVPGLREWGVQAADIHFEAFGPASVRMPGPVTNEPAAANPASIAVRFSRSGRTLAWDGQDANLLDFAERHGLAVDSGCRSGSCGACQTRLLSGSVTYADQPDHDIPKGHCLLCVGKPQADLVLDA